MKKKIKTYLLGGLDDARQNRLEERLLNDRELFEEVLISEDELVDQYLAGKLTDTEAKQFEAHFLVTSERQQKFRFGQALNKYLQLNDLPVVTAEAPVRTRWFLLGAFWPVRQVVTAAFVLVVATLITVAVYWLGVRPGTAPGGTPYVVSLVPGAIRSGGSGSGFQRITLPGGVTTVELRLAVADVNYKSYTAQLISGTGNVTEFRNLQIVEQNANKSVVITVQRDLLGPDDYQVKLNGISASGETKFIDSYSLRISGS